MGTKNLHMRLSKNNDRGQAYILGYFLLVALVVTSTSIIFISVVDVTQNSLESDQTASAERELTKLNSDITSPQFANRNSITPFQVKTKQNMRYNSETRIEVALVDDDGNRNELLNETTISPQYINPETGTTITYTMGGIFSTIREDPRKAPDMGVNGENIVINPVIIENVSENSTNTGTIESFNNMREREFPKQGQAGGIEDGTIEITISGAGRDDIVEQFENEFSNTSTVEGENRTVVQFDTEDVDSYTLNINIHRVSLRV